VKPPTREMVLGVLARYWAIWSLDRHQSDSVGGRRGHPLPGKSRWRPAPIHVRHCRGLVSSSCPPFGIALVKFAGLHQTQHDKTIVNKQPNVAIVIEQSSTLMRRALQQIAAKRTWFRMGAPGDPEPSAKTSRSSRVVATDAGR